MIMSKTYELSRRVVVTGLGVLSSLGIGAEAFWKRLAAGESGIAKMHLLPYSAAPHNVGGEVRNFVDQTVRSTFPKKQRKSARVMCREIRLGVVSATLALADSGIDLETMDHDRFGVDFGANLMFSPPDVLRDACWQCVQEDDAQRRFQYNQWGEVGLKNMEPLWLLKYLPNMPACHIGIFMDARGPNNSITLDEASGNLALGEAMQVILRGRADVMLAGTTGTRLHPVKSIHAALWDELASSELPPQKWCRPFDLNRTGQVLAEGACSFLLEDESHARSRGANILATILGSGSSCAFKRNGRPGIRQALVNAMRSALRDAGLRPDEIGHVNAHGLSSRDSDREEARAIQDIFGHDAEVPVTALKSYFGNAGSGCGTLELAGSLLGLKQGVVPATLNYETADPECPINVVHGQPLAVSNKTVLNINVTRMGQASALVASVE